MDPNEHRLLDTSRDDSRRNTAASTEGREVGDLPRRDFIQQATVGGLVVASGLSAGARTQGAESARAKPASAGRAVSTQTVKLNVNGQQHELKIDTRVTLLDALREYLALTGSKKGCDHGHCGACTVLVDDRRVYSCLTLAVSAVGKKITSIEGLASGDELHPVQAAFIARDGFQCGYCTSGQICSAVGLLNEGRAKNDAAIREFMSGNICRCGAYPNIVSAVRDARDAQAGVKK